MAQSGIYAVRLTTSKIQFIALKLVLLTSILISLDGITCAQAQNQPQSDVLDEVFQVFAPASMPYVDGLGENFEPDAMLKTKRYLDARNINYEVIFLPWSAAYKRVALHPRGLIVPIDRTPARESSFHWLSQVVVSDYYLYGVSGQHSPSTTLREAKESGAVISCGSNFAQCEVLEEAGIQRRNILFAENASVPVRYRLMINGRAEYTIFDPVVYEAICREKGLDPDRLIKLQKVGEQTAYLAASKGLSKPYLDALLADPK